MTVLAVLVGGIFGGVLRYTIDAVLPGAGASLSVIIAINLVGSFLLGVLAASAEVVPVPRWLQTGLSVGVVGSFTTFSTFCLMAMQLWSADWAVALCDIGLGMLGGPLSAYLGHWGTSYATQWMSDRREELSA